MGLDDGSDYELAWTGERLVTNVQGDVAIEHLHRYALAIELARDKTVLDVACGEGYGSNLLAQVAGRVIGVDIEPKTVRVATRKYSRDNLSFRVGSATDLPIDSASIDLVVSFETLEHLAEHERMLEEIRRVLVPGGTLIISTPDRKNYSDIPNYVNQFHVKELYYDEFKKLIDNYFASCLMLGQRVCEGSLIVPITGAGADPGEFESFRGNYETICGETGLGSPIYLVAIASDGAGPLPRKASVFEGIGIQTNKDQQLKEQEIRAQEQETRAQEQDRRLHEQEIRAQEQDLRLHEQGLRLHEQEIRAQEQDRRLHEQETRLHEQETRAQEQDRRLHEQGLRLHEQDLRAQEQDLRAQEQDLRLYEQGLRLREYEFEIVCLEREVAEVRRSAAELDTQKDRQIEQVKAERDQAEAALAEVRRALDEQDRRLSHKEEQLAWAEATLAGTFGSRSWRITAPLRVPGRLVRGAVRATRLVLRASSLWERARRSMSALIAVGKARHDRSAASHRTEVPNAVTPRQDHGHLDHQPGPLSPEVPRQTRHAHESRPG